MFNSDKFNRVRSSTRHFLGSSRKTRIISASALFLAICAFGAAAVAPMAPDASNLTIRSIVQEMDLPDIADQIASLEQSPQLYIHEEKIRYGDTLASVLMRLGVDDDEAESFIKSDPVARNVLQLKSGKRIQAQTTEDGQLQWLSMLTDSRDDTTKNLTVSRDGDGFKAYEAPAKLERRVEMHAGKIQSSLFAATDAAQIPDSVARQIVDMFATDIDFASDLQRGDRFDVVYETFWQNGEFVRGGRILAGEFQNGNKNYQSIWFDDETPRLGGGYYNFDGKSLKKAFLKSPLKFSRISSVFSMRKHPISGNWKQHTGVDFAAATGTPIRAAADGVVDMVATQNGYGNIVVLKHWSNITTAYAHMSRFAAGLRKGEKVSQGDVIGYVGSTGWATGPHLHYEFRVASKARDPMSVDIPNVQALNGTELKRFRTVAGDMTHRFVLLRQEENAAKLALK
ncbi:peptidoglycan DD-metalloendopeptidase family protein [Actimicrobium sp. CCC2.4]|uniref:M23 family metallopeptidase n=1 Tax=Actimicrobium sp. CCC2.4 TaxID=3048606 RepID=UPI002AC9D600|nr:peptidoglycan DD-metalloendopeptidase family protein [Actimicrobium sp. CCC2.4]MEB0134382.1 peptidoglycan DD-metalloendopeptidase family protein [Actimicrobium sp. CCC2.4]WPX33021.1 peptidoglycan DD-metalloendopeptidase family protein [Actimicrobium sp. CCC2.4]